MKLLLIEPYSVLGATEFATNATNATRNAIKRVILSSSEFSRVQLDCEALQADSRDVLECVGRPTATTGGRQGMGRDSRLACRRPSRREAAVICGGR